TFNEADEVIIQSTIERDEINFNGNKSFPYDEFLVPRKPPTQRTRNDDFLPYVHAFDPLSTNNFTIPDIVTSITHNINLSDESPDLLVADDQLVRNEPNELEPSEPHVNDNLKAQDITINDVIINNEAESSPTLISPSVEINHDTPSP
ncbi:hypothetical protein Tco_1558860, partial [Tanacetum coccineum]